MFILKVKPIKQIRIKLPILIVFIVVLILLKIKLFSLVYIHSMTFY
jgi:hypothetical protein